MEDLEILNEVFQLNSGAENVSEIHSSRTDTTVIKDTIKYKVITTPTNGVLELTLNPSNTKSFDSSEEAYLSMYRKILIYIHNSLSTFLEVVSDSYVFEFCKSGKRHLHSKIKVRALQTLSPLGIVYEISEYIAKLLRRKIPDSAVYYKFNRVQMLPFCLQYVYEQNSERVIYWENYMNKENIKNDLKK